MIKVEVLKKLMHPNAAVVPFRRSGAAIGCHSSSVRQRAEMLQQPAELRMGPGAAGFEGRHRLTLLLGPLGQSASCKM